MRLLVCTTLACVLAACSGREQQREERARHARQMRDVSRMLDDMEADKPATALPGASASATAIPPADAPMPGDGLSLSLLATLAVAVAGGLAIPALAMLVWRRRKRAAVPTPEPPSIVDCFAPTQPESPQPPPPAPPTWVYRSSPFETPAIQMTTEPVDLLVPGVDTRVPSLAQRLRIRLAEVAKLSGATRLFALRDLLADVAGHPDADTPAVVDARIDAQLAWATWVLGDAAIARLAEAERLCELVDGTGAAARTLRRRGEIGLRRAQLVKASLALPHLDRAQMFLDEAYAEDADAETALLVAQTALRRARLLPSDDAVAACSHALVHAFLAEQAPACRTDALACRLDIQLLYETLPDHAGHDGVTASLWRSLEASGPLAPAARIAVAKAHLRDGAHAKAASLCESIWRDGKADDKVLDVWRKACRQWADTGQHDEPLLVQSLRHLAIARSTL